MTRAVLLFVISLLYFIEAQEPEPKFVLHGKDLHLPVKKSPELTETTDFYWKINGNINAAKINYPNKPVVFSRYKERAEFVQNYSLLLKNVQHNDSGVYTAVVSGERDQTVAEYRVTVQDAVSIHTLTVTPVSSSSDSCNLTVTCSTEDLNISSIFTCNAQNCSQVEEKNLEATNSFSSLNVYLQQDSIFCKHSNQVSWNQSKEELKPHCETKSDSSGGTTVVISTSVSLFVITCIACIVTKWKRKNNNKEQENTVYEVPQDIISGQTQDQTPSRDASNLSPTSTYALVQFHTGSQSAQTKNTFQPETVYAEVDRSAKSNSRAQQSTPRDEKHRMYLQD